MAIHVSRGPQSTGDMESVKTHVRLSPLGGRGTVTFSQGVSLEFYLPAGGRGTSSVRVIIPSNQFAELAQAMMNHDPETAAKAFGQALVAGKITSNFDDIDLSDD